jgi:hypothetical protein
MASLQELAVAERFTVCLESTLLAEYNQRQLDYAWALYQDNGRLLSPSFDHYIIYLQSVPMYRKACEKIRKAVYR